MLTPVSKLPYSSVKVPSALIEAVSGLGLDSPARDGAFALMEESETSTSPEADMVTLPPIASSVEFLIEMSLTEISSRGTSFGETSGLTVCRGRLTSPSLVMLMLPSLAVIVSPQMAMLPAEKVSPERIARSPDEIEKLSQSRMFTSPL